MEPCGECHSLVLRRGHGATVHPVLKNHGDADRAWRREESPCRAKSEVLGRRKREAKVVIGKSEDFPAGVNNVNADALKNGLSIISGGMRVLRWNWSRFGGPSVVGPGRGAGPEFQEYRQGAPIHSWSIVGGATAKLLPYMKPRPWHSPRPSMPP